MNLCALILMSFLRQLLNSNKIKFYYNLTISVDRSLKQKLSFLFLNFSKHDAIEFIKTFNNSVPNRWTESVEFPTSARKLIKRNDGSRVSHFHGFSRFAFSYMCFFGSFRSSFMKLSRGELKRNQESKYLMKMFWDKDLVKITVLWLFLDIKQIKKQLKT